MPCMCSVSIHALLAECDLLRGGGTICLRCFNPRTPCGVRLWHSLALNCSTWFQSTHSLRSATGPLGTDDADPDVSIHALLAECDLSHRGTSDNHGVSIHALLAECDRRGRPVPCPVCGFNPRTPCGVRPFTRGRDYMLTLFQSTHSLRSATLSHRGTSDKHGVSIHALLAECDRTSLPSREACTCFNPRTPCGVRRAFKDIPVDTNRFNPRTPCGVRLGIPWL